MEQYRKDLLGHKNDNITIHYSQVEIYRLREMVESITEPYAHIAGRGRVENLLSH